MLWYLQTNIQILTTFHKINLTVNFNIFKGQQDIGKSARYTGPLLEDEADQGFSDLGFYVHHKMELLKKSF